VFYQLAELIRVQSNFNRINTLRDYSIPISFLIDGFESKQNLRINWNVIINYFFILMVSLTKYDYI
jgi:hypothetical protein